MLERTKKLSRTDATTKITWETRCEECNRIHTKQWVKEIGKGKMFAKKCEMCGSY